MPRAQSVNQSCWLISCWGGGPLASSRCSRLVEKEKKKTKQLRPVEGQRHSHTPCVASASSRTRAVCSTRWRLVHARRNSTVTALVQTPWLRTTLSDLMSVLSV